MKIVENFLTNNPCYVQGREMKIKGLMLHSVGCPQPRASVFLESWNKASYNKACVHGFIDGNDGTIYQTLPWNYRGWHCGGDGNAMYIGIEMCEPGQITYIKGSQFTCSNVVEARKVVKRTYEAAVELFAYLCEKYELDSLVDGVILSHKEGHKRGLASNHGDPEHLWNGLEMEYTMDDFRKDVFQFMKKEKNDETNITEKAEYRVKVIIPNLNIRKGPYPVSAFIQGDIQEIH